ncbi:MAG: DUF559 domain-containing protein [Chloroflexota bacterium]|nr:DUF559 domain-containing protein [Chloroflexota bacterium]MDE2940885.1 DUF559 domain-containing protein [Chloroflexota bacterium]MDE3268414.1 DUF559 domain-containing protein [Chloroflexota bacterium]
MTTKRARELRSNPTDAERKLWSHLRKRQVYGSKFRRQRPVGPYVVDFICLEKRLIVEVDGGQRAQQLTRDTIRDDYLVSVGFKVLRFWNNTVLAETDTVVGVIAQALEDAGDPYPRCPH